MGKATFDELISQGVEALNNRRLPEASQSFRAALHLRSLDAEAQSLYGLALVRLGRFAEAEPWLAKAVAREPDQAGFRFNLIELFEVTGRFDEAIAQLDAIVGKHPGELRAWSKLGDVQYARQHFEPAQRAYCRVVELDPGSLHATVQLCRTCAALNDLAGAQLALEAAVRSAPDHPATLRLQIDRLTAERRWPKLEEIAQRVCALHPNEAVGWYSLSRA